MNEETQQEEPLTDEEQFALLDKQQKELSEKIAAAKSAKAAQAIAMLSGAAVKRRAEEEQERLVLAEIRARRVQREKEANDEADRLAEEGHKQVEERTAQAAMEKAARLAAEKVKDRLREETNKAFMLEAELQRELLADTNPVAMEDAKPATLETLPTPLSRIFGGKEGANKPYEGLSSEANSKIVAKRDAITNALEFGVTAPVVVQTAQPTPEAAPTPTNRKTTRYVDIGTSRELEALLIKELKLNIPGNKLDDLSATFNYAPLMIAARVAILEFQAKPMSADGLMARIEFLADAEQMVGGGR